MKNEQALARKRSSQMEHICRYLEGGDSLGYSMTKEKVTVTEPK